MPKTNPIYACKFCFDRGHLTSPHYYVVKSRKAISCRNCGQETKWSVAEKYAVKWREANEKAEV